MPAPQNASRNPNDAGFQDRLDFITSLLTDRFGLDVETSSVEPIAYEEDFPFPYNNYVYAVDADLDAETFARPALQPGTARVPDGVKRCVVRLANPASGYNDRVRVENEVASLAVGRDALSPRGASLVPRVYAWGSAKDGAQGFIVQEFMPGKGLLQDFPELSAEDQKTILDQMADILGYFQRFTLPSSVKGYGGLGFDGDGALVSTAMSIIEGGPFESYDALVLATIRSKLGKANQNDLIKGWREDGIRDRLEKFLTSGFPDLMTKVSETRKVLVHADFTTDNVLYDPQTLRITAVIDFDFAHVATVADEFFRSLGHGIGTLPDAREGKEAAALSTAMLHGFPVPLPPATDEVNWPMAKVWDDSLAARNVRRPSTIPGMQTLSGLFWLSSQLLPFRMTHPVVVANSTEEQLAKQKANGQKLLSEFLAQYGF